MDVTSIIIVLAFLVGLIVKSYLPSYSKEKGKNLATKEDISRITSLVEEVKSVYSKNLEEIKKENSLELQKHNIVFQLLHEKQFETLINLHSKLQECQQFGYTAAREICFKNEPSRKEKAENFYKATFELSPTLNKSKLLLPEDCYESIENLRLEYQNIAISYHGLFLVYSEKEAEDPSNNFKQTRIQMDLELAALLHKLKGIESRLRDILGLEYVSPNKQVKFTPAIKSMASVGTLVPRAPYQNR